MILYLILLTLHAFSILFDEFYFHKKRGLPLWERMGHPFDTLTVLFCVGLLIFFPTHLSITPIYTGLAIFSCLVVTKDEFIHQSHCDAKEQWLHAILFILHPVVLWIYYQFWLEGKFFWLNIIFSILCIHMMYQLVYWNLFQKNRKGSLL